MTYNSFISGLYNYKEDKQEIDKLKEKIRNLEYLETGVKGVDPGKEHFNGNPDFISQTRLGKIDDIDKLKKEIDIIQTNLNRVIEQFNKQDKEIKAILNDIYFKKKKKNDVSISLGFKTSTDLDRYLKRSYIY